MKSKSPFGCWVAMVFCLSVSQASAAMMTGHFNWAGDAGYSAHAKFEYDDAFPIVYGRGAASGSAGVQGILNLWVSLYDPAGQPLVYARSIVDEQNITNGVASYYYLQFSFDTASQRLVPDSRLDLGTAGVWLFGSGGGNIGVRSDAANAGVLDTSRNYSVAVQVPETGHSGRMLSVGVTLIGLTAWAGRRKLLLHGRRL